MAEQNIAMVEINNLTENKIESSRTKETIELVLKREKKQGDISVALIGPGRMRKLNKKYRGLNRVTDVLSFSEAEVEFGKFAIGQLKKTKNLGEIVVCPREILKTSRRQKSDFQKELDRVFIHGTLHLLGYDHEQTKEKSDIMRKKEEEYLLLIDN